MAGLAALWTIIALGFMVYAIYAAVKGSKLGFLNTRNKAIIIAVVTPFIWFIGTGILAINDHSTLKAPTKNIQTVNNNVTTDNIELPKDSYENDNISYKITEIDMPNSVGLSKETAGDGGILVALIIDAKNIGTEPVKASAINYNVKLVDENGVEYRPDTGKTSLYKFARNDINQKIISDLNPDISTKNAFIFEVSKTKFNRKSWYATIDGNPVKFPKQK